MSNSLFISQAYLYKKIIRKKSATPFITISEMLVDCWPSSSSMLVFSGRYRGGGGGGAAPPPPPLCQGLDLTLGVDKVMRSEQTCQTNIEGKSGEIYVCCS